MATKDNVAELGGKMRDLSLKKIPVPHELDKIAEKDNAMETKSRMFINYRYQSKLHTL